MPSYPAIAHAAPRAAAAPAAVAGQGGALGDADLFGQALNTARTTPTPTLAALPPSRGQGGLNNSTGFDTPDGAHAASSASQALSNALQSASALQSAPAAVNQTLTAANAATATATTLTTKATPSTTTTATTPPTALQSAATNATASATAAKANLKQQFAVLKTQFQAQPVSTTTAALAGMQTTLQSASNAVSASTATGVTNLLKQASVGVTGGPGAMQAHLANLNQQLNKIEARETGVDPSAPPVGWTEPPIFSQARSLLNSLAGGTATTPTAMAATGDPLATAGLPLAGAATPTTAAGANAAASTTGTGVAQSAQTGQIAAALQATQATGAVGATQLDPQMLKAAAGPTPAPLSAPAQTTSASKEPSRIGADRDASSTTTVADASAIAAKVVTPATPNKDAAGDNNASLGAPVAEQLADEAADLLKDAKADAAPAMTVASQAADAQAAQTQTASQTQLQAQLAAQTQATQTQAAQATQATPDASHPATAYLAAQMVKQLDGRSTQFDLQLHPADLGRVDVQMRIQQDGKLNAQLAFDNPAAAAEFRGRSDELRQQLQQAGFKVSDDSLSFSERNPQGFGQQQSGGQQSQSGWDQPDVRSRAFQNSTINAQTADVAASSSSRVVTGLDMRV